MTERPPTQSANVLVNRSAIRRHRQDLGLSVKDLAARVAVSGAYLSQIETGARPRVSPDVFKRLCDALGVKPDDLRADEMAVA